MKLDFEEYNYLEGIFISCIISNVDRNDITWFRKSKSVQQIFKGITFVPFYRWSYLQNLLN